MTLQSGSRRPLPHLAYLEALADSEEDTSRWHALTAGYAVLQLFELWVEYDHGAVVPSELELRRVRKRVELMEVGDPIRRCLTHLVQVLGRPRPPRGSPEEGRRSDEAGRILAAYGKLLQYESSWSLSRDVYETLVGYAWGADDEERLLDSMLMVAFCHRMLGQLDEAREAYSVLRETAARLGSEQYLLLSELGFAKLASERGNLPAAAGMLDRILEETSVGKHDNVRWRALMDRARVASQLGDHTTAAILSHQALERSTDPIDRDRILINIGMTLTHMGLWNEARDAYLIAGASAQESAVRWMAQINLMELAYLERNEPLFEHHRRAIAGIELPPYVETVFHETRAHGLRAFGHFSEARSAFECMLAIAERHGLHEFVLKAEQALANVARASSPLVSTTRSDIGQQPIEITRVADCLVRLREHAGI